MKTKQTTTTVEKGEEKTFNLTQAFVLWEDTSKAGRKYLNGRTSEELDSTKLVGFYNTNKKNPKEPDIRIYVEDSKGEREEVCSLWENISKSEKRYLTGTTNENEKIIAFYNNVEEYPNRPYIRAYYKQD